MYLDWKRMRRFITLPLILILVAEVTACTVRRVRQVDPDQVTIAQAIVGVTTVDGQEVRFDRDPPARLRRTGPDLRDMIVQAFVMSQQFETTLDRVQHVWVERREGSTVRTVALVAAVAAATAALIVVAVNSRDESPAPAPAPAPAPPSSQSCPFVYSWDGTRYVFDAEPYGGATTRGLERNDLSELEHMVSVGGEYRLLLTNEQEETQFSNLVELQVVDHPLGTRVITDIEGRFHTVGVPETALKAWDGDGQDLSPWLAARDGLIWEPPAVADADGNVRGEINLTFRKPVGAREAKLVANAGTGLWGSQMIRTLLQLRGRELPLFYGALDTNPLAVDLLSAWTLREDLYALKVFLENDSGWTFAGVLPGGGPYSVEDRAVRIDLSDTPDSEIMLQLRPPVGFWAINTIALDFSADANIHVETLAPFEAPEETGRDVLALVSDDDDRYYEMPQTSNRATMRFRAPEPVATGMTRTVFLHSRGYYRLHLDPQGAPQTALLDQIAREPDTAARFAAVEYAEWLAGLN